MRINNYENKKIGILGLGTENIALVKFLVGKNAHVTICDRKRAEDLEEYLNQIVDLDVDYRFGSDYLDNLKDFEIVFRTPGLPFLNEKIQKALKDGVEVSSEIRLFFQNSPSPILGVTGTKGKGTTATLIGEILKVSNTYENVYLAGNIGNPPIEFLDKLTEKDLVVLELSSFQLQDLDISPHLAVVLNIDIDHLDYHLDRQEYITAKENIVKFQNENDIAVLNADYEVSADFSRKTKAKIYWFSKEKYVNQGCCVENGEIILSTDQDISILKTDEVMLRGIHNLENITAAIMASYLMGADISVIKNVVRNFKGLEHRLELFLEKDGIKFYNDSFSTTPETAIAAIKSFTEPIILIAGGSEKNADYSKLGEVISCSNIKTAILIGKTGPRIKKESMPKGTNEKIKVIDTCQDLDQVIEKVKEEAKPGDVVLLSPASASFDWFSNYKERGNKFKEKILNAYF